MAVFGYEINLVNCSTRGETRNMFLLKVILEFCYLDLVGVKEEHETQADQHTSLKNPIIM